MHIIGINRGILVTLDPLFNDVLLPFQFLFPKAIAPVVGGIMGGIRINVPIFGQDSAEDYDFLVNLVRITIDCSLIFPSICLGLS